MNFDSLIIVTYARSGSTLLQNLINTIPNVCIRGENYNFCWGLYLGYRALKSAKLHHGHHKNIGSSTHPWFGADKLSLRKYIQQARLILKSQLIPNGSNISCYGFKEIRYSEHPNELFDYLNFLQSILPNLGIIFNTRLSTDVCESVLWKSKEKKTVLNHIDAMDKLFYIYAKNNSNCFINRYENLTKGGVFAENILDFLGVSLRKDQLEKVLAEPSSYAQKVETLIKAKTSRDTERWNAQKISTLPKILKPDINNTSNINQLAKVIVMACVYNEIQRLPYWLEHYRNLGCKQFIVIDTGSTDNSQKYLSSQRDVMLFHCHIDAYKQSKSGRHLINKLARIYALYRWVLMVDLDEIICPPQRNMTSMNDIANLATRLGLNRIFTPMIDVYPERAIDDQNKYIPGKPFSDWLKFIDSAEQYKFYYDHENSRYALYGGPRFRLGINEISNKETMYFVSPDGFKHEGAHYHNYKKPSPLVVPLLHYKFMPFFSKKNNEAIVLENQYKNSLNQKLVKSSNMTISSVKTALSVRCENDGDLSNHISHFSNILLSIQGTCGSGHLVKRQQR